MSNNTRRNTTLCLTMTAMMAVVAFVLQYLSFNVPFLSPFANFDLSALPELIGGFILGPIWAVAIVIVKLILILIFKGTSSMYSGEIQNFLLSVAYILPALLYYRSHRTRKGALIGVVLGSLTSVVVAIFTNLYLVYPMYIKLFGMSWEQIIGICNKANGFIKDIPTFVIFSVIPFNLIARALTSLLTMLLYKRISAPLKKFIQGK